MQNREHHRDQHKKGTLSDGGNRGWAYTLRKTRRKASTAEDECETDDMVGKIIILLHVPSGTRRKEKVGSPQMVLMKNGHGK